jgi:uncharacterized protein (DUF1778 family)
MGKKPVMRRRMSMASRRAILSYYTNEERQEIERAAASQRVSLSNFVAMAALQQAAVVNSKTSKTRR